MQMHDNYEPIPEQLHQRMRVMQHDLAKVREHMAAGRIRPEQFADLERALGARIEVLEAEVHARLLAEARRGGAPSWRPRAGLN